MRAREPMLCYCGHDCARCKTYVATVTDDAAMREEVVAFNLHAFGIEVRPEDVRCKGGRSDSVFYLCEGCPWIACCRERDIEACSECGEYPCGPLEEYIERYVNKVNQVDP